MSAFPPEREAGLKGLSRYSMFELMYYRPNLWQHSHRVLWLIEALAPIAQTYLQIDIEKARIMGFVHDDAEMVTGDIQAGHKARMSAEELAKLDQNEERAAAELAARYPKEVHGYNYESLLVEMVRKESIESMLVSYADKLDAYCESMHELHAGNMSLLRSTMFYVKAMTLFPTKFPPLREFLADTSSPLIDTADRLNPDISKAELYADLAPYTEESIRRQTDFPFYNEWRRMNIARGGEEGVRWLIEQREYNAVN
jgi:5'-deoxynucleotidase YfbR-like HD superfamily hydrolase